MYPWSLDAASTSGERYYFAISCLKSVTFGTDSQANVITPVTILIAGVWSTLQQSGTEMFYLLNGSWIKTNVSVEGQQTKQSRACIVYQDKVTGVDRIFVGTSVEPSNPAGIYSGVWDSAQNQIVWSPSAEAWAIPPDPSATVVHIRVASFAECNGKLYAAAYDSIYERQDGPSPIWTRVFQHTTPGSNVAHGTGFRGLTALLDPVSQREVLLVGNEGRPMSVFKILPDSGFAFAVDIDITRYLQNIWNLPVKYGVVSYNNMMPYQDCLLIGIFPTLVGTPFQGLGPTAKFLVRHLDATYDLQEISDPAHSTDLLLSTRALCPSPFPDDPTGTLYASGFDACYRPVHNTAWIYKGTPLSA